VEYLPSHVINLVMTMRGLIKSSFIHSLEYPLAREMFWNFDLKTFL
jgi:hypothetical protein